MLGNLEYYKVFYYVAKCGSVTKAAAELSITQPAASQSLKLLEQNLGVALFHRVSRGVSLTAEGQALFAYVEKGYNHFEQGYDVVMKMKNLEAGEVRIGASDMTLRFFLLPYLEKFHTMYPDIKVVVSNGPTPETLKALANREIDFGVVSSPFDAGEEVQARDVHPIEDVFVAGRKFIPLKNHMMDFSELAEYPTIFLEGGTSSRRFMDAFLKGKGVTLHPEFELATSDMIVQFALRNLGIGCVVRDFAKEALDNGTLFELRFNELIPKRNFSVVKNSRQEMSLAAGKLLDILGIGEKND